MGEPPATANNEVDANQRLRRMYYSEAPNNANVNYRRFRLGRAVGASACVPVLFKPVEMPSLYPDLNIQLVDGGVHDNQGVSSLLEQGCTVMLVSDGSGQLADDADPRLRAVKIGLRADEIAQERVRVAEYQELESRVRSGLLRTLMFLHLKKDVDVPPKDWVGCPLPYHASEEAKPAADSGPLTTYGINREIQRAIAAIRTDLDSFNNAEAWALMTSGYRMTETHFPPKLNNATVPELPDAERPWRFLCIADRMAEPTADSELLSLLKLSRQRFFKAWDWHTELPRLRTPLMVAGLIAAVLIVALVWSAFQWPVAVLAAIVVALVLLIVLRRHVLAFAVAMGARLYLRHYNDTYLEKGRVTS
jgi:hypothetical protein